MALLTNQMKARSPGAIREAIQMHQFEKSSYRTLLKAYQLGLLLYNTRRIKDIYHDPYMCQNYAYRVAYHDLCFISNVEYNNRI